jgi:hypothetical protein
MFDSPKTDRLKMFLNQILRGTAAEPSPAATVVDNPRVDNPR